MVITCIRLWKWERGYCDCHEVEVYMPYDPERRELSPSVFEKVRAHLTAFVGTFRRPSKTPVKCRRATA
jgi:hypothetical protein